MRLIKMKSNLMCHW